MKLSILVAKIEIKEQIRQPSMLLVMVLNYLIFASLFLFLIFILDTFFGDPQLMKMLDSEALKNLGVKNLSMLVPLVITAFGTLLFTNLSLYSALLSGYSLLNDKENGTFPFLMLSPLSSFELLLGKVMGAIYLPFLIHLFFVGTTTLLLRQFEILEPYFDKFGSSAAWWFAFLIGSPLSAFFVSAIGGLISSLSRDVRTAFIYISFVVGFTSLLFGFTLFEHISSGIPLQILYAFLFCLFALMTLMIGTRTLKRDLN